MAGHALRIAVLAASVVFGSVIEHAAPASEAPLQPDAGIAIQRAPQIFNAISDSLRKWGTTVHLNGMSLYLATIPDGVLLYHGNSRNETPTDVDWLAYEIEHAEMFARPRRGRPPPAGEGGISRIFSELRRRWSGRRQDQGDTQVPLAPSDDSAQGWLHVYRTTRALPFLYVDGLSGNKQDTGVIDTQDILLRGKRDDNVWDERGRVADICDLCSKWDLQGIIRAESPGFEIVKCDFFDGLEQVQSLPRGDREEGDGRPGGPPPKERPGRGRGGGPWHSPGEKPEEAERYSEVERGRTVIDFSSMVSAFFFDVDLTNPDPKQSRFPRLTGTSEADMDAIREYLSQVVRERRGYPSPAVSWRDKVDLIVKRYADRIETMSKDVKKVNDMAQHVRFLLDVFIDYSVEDEARRTAEAWARCATFYIQTVPLETESDRLIYTALEAVGGKICLTLFEVRELVSDASAGSKAIKESKKRLGDLKNYLDWAAFV